MYYKTPSGRWSIRISGDTAYFGFGKEWIRDYTVLTSQLFQELFDLRILPLVEAVKSAQECVEFSDGTLYIPYTEITGIQFWTSGVIYSSPSIPRKLTELKQKYKEKFLTNINKYLDSDEYKKS